MRRASRFLFVPALLLIAASAEAQPTITSVTPNYGGGGPNSPQPFTIIGSGFLDTTVAPKAVRFVDIAGNDVLTGVSCANTTMCTVFGVRKYRVPPGSVQTIQVYALVDGVRSSIGVNFKYYGPPIVNSVVPSTAANYDSSQAYTINGGGFTSGGTGFPGTTSIYLANAVHDFAAGCASTSACNDTAPSLTYSCCEPQGAKTIDIKTPGGTTTATFVWGAGAQTPATPTVTGISASTGPLGGGNSVTITGTNFIPGAQVAIGGGFTVTRGTHFSFKTAGGSNEATGVNCSSATRCSLVVPSGTPGPADIVVYTVCGAGLSPCSGNARPSVSVSRTRSGLYAYPGLKLTPGNVGSPLNITENGGSAYYFVALYSPPSADVQVDIAMTPLGGGTLSLSSVNFTRQNWAIPQAVYVTGLDDAGATGNQGFTINHLASSSDSNYDGASAAQPVTRWDNETKHVVITPETGLYTTRANGSTGFTIVLSKAPSAAVTITFTSNDTFSGLVSPTSVTFDTSSGMATSWNTPRFVRVFGQSDSSQGTDRDYVVLVTTSSDDPEYNNSGNVPDVFLTNVDVPVAPPGLTLVRTGPTTAVASWTTVPGTQWYYVSYSTAPGDTKTLMQTTTLTSATLTDLTVGQQYYFVVSSVNKGAGSPYSVEVPFKLLPPGPPGAFDGDSKAEMVVYTPAGVWKILNSIGGYTTNTSVILGGTGSTPVPGDYDGDQRQDVAVYNSTTGAWTILKSSTNNATSINVSYGGPGYVPVPGDYDGDGKTDIAVYQLNTGNWSILTSGSNYTESLNKSWGGGGYTPIPGQDFDGDSISDIAVYRQANGVWYVLTSSTNFTGVFSRSWGGVGYTLVPGDYDGDHKTDLGLYQRSTGAWAILLSGAGYTTTVSRTWGGLGFVPVPADFDADGRTDLGIVQQTSGNWSVRLSGTNYATTLSVAGWGTSADRVISPAIYVGGDDASRASDFDGDGRAEIATYDPSNGAWATRLSTTGYVSTLNISFGGIGYMPVPGDYDGDGRTDYGLYQPSTGNWSILLSTTNFTLPLNKSAGGPGWIPMPGDYDGDGRTDLVVYNTTTGQWYGLKSGANYTTTFSVSYGGTGYTAVDGDFDGDARTDIAVYNTVTGAWSVLTSSSNYTASLSASVGGAGWSPVAADYDADGKTDFVVYNTTTGVWYGLKSSSNYTTTVNVNWGGTGYTPIKGDYDGDGKIDLAVYQGSTGNWYILLSNAGYTTSFSSSLGGTGYVPLPQYP